jgi:hypothetical protein
MTATMMEGAESCGVTVELADARGPSATSTVPCRSTVDVGDLIIRIIEAAAASPTWRNRVQLAKGFAEDVARMLAEQGLEGRRTKK